MLNEVKAFDSSEENNPILSGTETSKVYWRKLNCSQTSCTPMRFGKRKRFNKKEWLDELNDYFDEQNSLFITEQGFQGHNTITDKQKCYQSTGEGILSYGTGENKDANST